MYNAGGDERFDSFNYDPGFDLGIPPKVKNMNKKHQFEYLFEERWLSDVLNLLKKNRYFGILWMQILNLKTLSYDLLCTGKEVGSQFAHSRLSARLVYSIWQKNPSESPIVFHFGTSILPYNLS